MLDTLTKFATKVACLQGYTVKTAERTTVARELLQTSEGKSAAALLMALRSLYGVDVLYWEPETIWLSLINNHKIDLPEEARNKLQAAISLIRNPAFFWDSLVFQRTVQALNGEVFDPEALQECNPAYMAWAVYEALLIRGLDPDSDAIPELDEDVQQYIAVCLKRAGFVYPPLHLKPVADNLAHMLPASQAGFADDIKKSWERLDKGALPERKFKEDSQGVQLAQLAGCAIYVQECADAMATDILALEQPQITS